MSDLVERHSFKRGTPQYNELDNTMWLGKNLFNATLYNVRQHFFNTGEFLGYYKLQKAFQDSSQPDYTALPAKVAQHVMQDVDKSFLSFFRALKEYKKNPSKYQGRPRMPKYKDKKKGRYMLRYTYQAISKRILDKYGQIKLSGLDVYIDTKLKYEQIKEVRVIQKVNSIVVEIVYGSEDVQELPDNGLYAAIDLGVSNFATVTSNKKGFQPMIVDGRKVKSYNRYYNKEKAKKQSILKKRNNKRTSNEIKRLTEKRNNKMSDFIHKSSRVIVNQLVSEGINTLVIGHNKGWKQDINIGKHNNQNFTEIPFSRFISTISYKCRMVGIRVIVTEESYTSKCSFLDMEEICKHDSYAGKRVKRGLFRSGGGSLINADVNASYNILRKCMPKAFADGVEGVLVHPRITKILN